MKQGSTSLFSWSQSGFQLSFWVEISPLPFLKVYRSLLRDSGCHSSAKGSSQKGWVPCPWGQEGRSRGSGHGRRVSGGTHIERPGPLRPKCFSHLKNLLLELNPLGVSFYFKRQNSLALFPSLTPQIPQFLVPQWVPAMVTG